MKHSRIIEIPDRELNEKLIPSNDNDKPKPLSMDSEQSGVLQDNHYNPKVEGLPVWQMALLFFCVMAIGFYVFRLAT